jgi:hypothetical protein
MSSFTIIDASDRGGRIVAFRDASTIGRSANYPEWVTPIAYGDSAVELERLAGAREARGVPVAIAPDDAAGTIQAWLDG